MGERSPGAVDCVTPATTGDVMGDDVGSAGHAELAVGVMGEGITSDHGQTHIADNH